MWKRSILSQWFILLFSVVALSGAAYAAQLSVSKNNVVDISARHSASKAETETPFFRSWDKPGWWWNKYRPEPEEKDEKEEQQPDVVIPPPLSTYTYEQLWNMHPTVFQPLLLNYLRKAIMTPSEENVRDYYIIQDIARRKAAAFTNVATLVWQKYPELNMMKDAPVNPRGASAARRLKYADITQRLTQSSNDYALLYFFSPTCEFCIEQSGILKFFTEKYPHWQIRHIDITARPDIAQRFGINTVPVIMVVSRETGKYMPVAAGVVPMTTLESNIYNTIRLMRGEIAPEQFNLYDYQRGTTLDPLHIVPIGNPTVW